MSSETLDQEILGRNAYARHRGCFPNAVTAASKGRIASACIWEGDRLVGVRWRQADELWMRNTDPVAAEKSNKASMPEPAKLPTESDQANYLKHRAETEQYRAKAAKLEYLERVGALVSAVDVEREVAKIFSQVKSSVMRLAAKKSAILAAETDPARVERLLNDSFSQVFDELSRGLAAVAAGEEEGAPRGPTA